MFSYTARRDAIFDYDPWYLVGDDRELQVAVRSGRRQGAGLIAQFEGLDTREQVAPLVGLSILVAATQLPPLDDGEYYWSDLIGLQVVTRDGYRLGIVERLFETGANDVIVVSGERERLLPYTPQIVLAVDLANQVITVDWDPTF